MSEARDLGDVNRYQLYYHLKPYTAAPPDVLRVDEKNWREYYILNCCGVVITTNQKDSVYLPADDRRTYVAWSNLTKDEFDADYWTKMWKWYDAGGDGHVAAYLDRLDIASFNAKAPPRQTEVFWQIVQINILTTCQSLSIDTGRPAISTVRKKPDRAVAGLHFPWKIISPSAAADSNARVACHSSAA
jgi:hypothetical protein